MGCGAEHRATTHPGQRACAGGTVGSTPARRRSALTSGGSSRCRCRGRCEWQGARSVGKVAAEGYSVKEACRESPTCSRMEPNTPAWWRPPVETRTTDARTPYTHQGATTGSSSMSQHTGHSKSASTLGAGRFVGALGCCAARM
eukprot:350178-Chlamydomonas_euryale.AAC.3